jgi:hypothetical protein
MRPLCPALVPTLPRGNAYDLPGLHAVWVPTREHGNQKRVAKLAGAAE